MIKYRDSAALSTRSWLKHIYTYGVVIVLFIFHYNIRGLNFFYFKLKILRYFRYPMINRRWVSRFETNLIQIFNLNNIVSIVMLGSYSHEIFMLEIKKYICIHNIFTETNIKTLPV